MVYRCFEWRSTSFLLDGTKLIAERFWNLYHAGAEEALQSCYRGEYSVAQLAAYPGILYKEPAAKVLLRQALSIFRGRDPLNALEHF